MYRKLLEWEWYTDSKMVHLFLHMLLKANHKPGKWKGIPVNTGQFISGRKVLSVETGLSERSIRTCIDRLVDSDVLTIKTTNKYSVFSINNWEIYQNNEQVDLDTAQQVTINRPTNDQQTTTNKNEKNEKNEKNKLCPEFFEVSEYLKIRVLQVRQQKITEKTINDWSKCVRLMVERDNRTLEQIKILIDECHDMEPRGPSGFTWRNNILSMSKLRERWNEGKIFIGMNKNSQPRTAYAKPGSSWTEINNRNN